MTKNYQFNYSEISESIESMYDSKKRILKAKKTIKILKDYLKETKEYNLLDIGCSTGIMTNEYSKHFKEVIGLDLDSKAISYAQKKFEKKGLTFICKPIEEKNFEENVFDVITCSHIYEHVPDDKILLDKIFKLLKPGGVCYFAAGNKFQVVEPHYKLPFLSYFPKKIANFYIRLFTKEKKYYENHKSYSELKALVSRFEIIDYTLEVINNPSKYAAENMLKERTVTYYLINFIAKNFYFMIPTYIWLLKKPITFKPS